MKYEPKSAKLKRLIAELDLIVDYDPAFTTVTIVEKGDTHRFGTIQLDGVSASPFDRDQELIYAIEEHPRYEDIVEDEEPAEPNIEKTAMTLQALDGEMWYAVSTRRVKELTPALFGENGTIWLTRFPEIGIVRALNELGRRRVGFNISGDRITGTLQIEFPEKLRLTQQFYVYHVDPKSLPLAMTYRVADFQYMTRALKIRPSKTEVMSASAVRRFFKIEPLIKSKKESK